MKNKPFEIIDENECIKIVRGLKELKKKFFRIPEVFRNGKEVSIHNAEAFDVNDFLSVFDRVKLQDGYVLDYIYAVDNLGGAPLIYSRKLTDKPLSNSQDYCKTFNIFPFPLLGQEPSKINSSPYLNNIQFENSNIGYFQFALFCMTVRRFYLHWHANYNDRRYVIAKYVLNNIIYDNVGNCNKEEVILLRSIDFRPKLIIEKDSAEIIIFCYERNIGYSNLHVFVTWPNIFEKIIDEVIIKTNMHIMY